MDYKQQLINLTRVMNGEITEDAEFEIIPPKAIAEGKENDKN